MSERYTSSPHDTEDILMAIHGTPDTGNTKTISTSAAAAATIGLIPECWYRCTVTADAHLHFHMTEDATTSHMFVNVDTVEYFYTGTITRVSAIQSAGAGVVYLTPMITNTRVSA